MTTSTLTVTEFVSARIAEDEGVARSAEESGGGDWWTIEEMVPRVGGRVYDLSDADHIAMFGPARVLAQCAAMRKIVEYHDGRHECSGPDDNNCMWIEHADDCPTMLALASIWSDHPDWREEWR
jgi:hypothetical protein